MLGASTTAVLVGILPTIGVALLFWYVMRIVIRADRNERAAIAQQEAQERATTEQSEAQQPTTEQPGIVREGAAPDATTNSRDGIRAE